MKLSQKISIASIILLLIPTTIITILTIYNLQNKASEDIESYREEQVAKSELRLQNVVDLAFNILENSYEETGSIDVALGTIENMRFDGEEGYFWITDTAVPPKMIMHAADPALNGRIMQSDFSNKTDDIKSQNSYSERAQKTKENGEAFVAYKMVKPGEEKIYSKLSYSRLFKPLGLVIASGIYTDSIDEAVAKKQEELKSQISGLILQSVLVALIVLAIGLFVALRFSKQIVDYIIQVRDKLVKLAKGSLVEKMSEERRDELGDIAVSLNQLVSSTHDYISLAQSIRKGNLDLDTSSFDEDDAFARELIAMRDNLSLVIDDVNNVIKKAEDEGDLSARVSMEKKEGVWLEMSNSVNRLLNSMAEPLDEVKDIFSKMANGNFSGKYSKESRGDVALLAESINVSIDQLSSLLRQFASTTDQVQQSSVDMLSVGEEMGTTTNEIASAISQMSAGAQTQVSKIDEVSALFESIQTSAAEMTSKANEINLAAHEGSEKSDRGETMLLDLINRISDINNQALVTQGSIDTLKMRSGEISQVLNVITEIAGQTNLLALNAAIEAAQAGDAGRGFAVVAEEIRKLAEDSRKSASQIEKLISEVNEDTNKAAQAMDEMNERVKSGSELSNTASQIFKEIALSSNTTYTLSNEITEFSARQVDSLKNVVGITEEVVVISEQAAAGTEEVASSASELASGMTNYKQKLNELSSIAVNLNKELSKLQVS